MRPNRGWGPRSLASRTSLFLLCVILAAELCAGFFWYRHSNQAQEQGLISTVRSMALSASSTIAFFRKLPQDYRHLVLGVAGWMRYVSGTDEQGNKIDVRDPLAETFAAICAKHGLSVAVVDELLAIESIFGNELPKQQGFVDAVKRAYQQLLDVGARQAVAAL